MHLFSNSEMRFSLDDRQLLHSAILTEWAPPDAPTVGSSSTNNISLCGVLDLLIDDEATVTGRSAIFVQGASGNWLTSRTSTAYMLDRKRVSQLQMGNMTICAPSPGSSFAYTMTLQHQRKQTKFNTLAELIVRVSCKVETKKRNGSEIDRSIPEPFLDVACTQVVGDNSETTRYAYLLDSQIYLPLSIDGDMTGRLHYTYADAKYLQR